MTHIEKAIREAVEYGWKLRDGFPAYRIDSLPSGDVRYWYRDPDTRHEYHEIADTSEIFLDPLFWQALGKARWEGRTKYPRWQRNDDATTRNYLTSEWTNQMHHFIQLLADGKDPESFFEELYKGKE